MDKYELRRLGLLRLMNEQCDGKVASMAARLERSPSYVSRMLYEEGKLGKKRIGDDLLSAIIEKFQLPAGWPEVEASPPIPGSKSVVLLDEDSPILYRIPKVALRLQAGVTGFQTEPDRRDGGTMGLSKSWVERKGYDPEKLLSIDVRGESMEPTFYEGDTVVINLADTKPVDNGVFAVNYNGEAVIKRFSRDMGKWWLMSDNADQRRFYRRVCQGDECIIIGRVVRREGDHF